MSCQGEISLPLASLKRMRYSEVPGDPSTAVVTFQRAPSARTAAKPGLETAADGRAARRVAKSRVAGAKDIAAGGAVRSEAGRCRVRLDLAKLDGRPPMTRVP
mmetsp:Transcript_126829/g.405561  ORF Transcript_126829/g.405561 Transcript_126829/m.405561 type:complete len:103 (-) Transcript_126829:15-323(-)